MIVVIDYKVGNVESVCKAFKHIGCEVTLSRGPAEIEQAEGLVLPGVAAFGYAIEALGEAAEPVKEAALAGKPLLGICVGYQLLFEKSCEYGAHQGLGLIRGQVVPIPPGRVVPHMGWNRVELPGGYGPLRRPGRSPALLLRPLVLCPGRGPAGQDRLHRLRIPADCGRPEGQHLRRPVPPGKERPAGPAGAPELLRDLQEKD